MKKSLLVIASIFILPLGLAFGQPADPPCGPGGPGEPGMGPGPKGHRGHGPGFMLGMFDRIVKQLPEKLEFTPEQKEKFATLTKKHREAMEVIVKQLEQEKKKFESDLNEMLTPEQQAKLKELKKAREFVQKRFKEGVKPQPLKQGMVARAVKELNLPPEKNERVMDILTDYRAKFQAAPKGDRQARQQAMKEMMEKVRDALAPEEFQRLQEVLRAQRGEMGRGHGEHRGGPGQPGNRPNQPGPQGEPGQPVPPPPAEQQEDPLF